MEYAHCKNLNLHLREVYLKISIITVERSLSKFVFPYSKIDLVSEILLAALTIPDAFIFPALFFMGTVDA